MNSAFLYAGTVSIWGTTWFAITFQLGVVTPAASIAYRFALASLILLVYCRLRGLPMRFDRRAHAFTALLGFFLFSLNYIFFYQATETVTSGLVALSFSSSILMNIFFGALFLGSPVRLPVVLGGVMGIAGIGLVYWPELAGFGAARASLGGLVLCVLATALASLGNIVSARNQRAGMPVVQTNAFGMAYGSAFMAVAVVLQGKSFDFEWTAEYMGSLLYLAFFGSVVGFGCYLTLLGRIGADRAAYANILHPVVAIGVSTVFEGFQWTWPAVLGAILVVAGNVIVLRRARRPA
jgi:drug/metabolite transporter (DMT)-like permease